MPTPGRHRTSTPSSPTDPPKTQLRATAQRPWLEHPTLCGLRGRLQLVVDCWILLELPDGTSRRPVQLPRVIEEPETCCLKQCQAARPTGFYCDALLTYAGILAQLNWQERPDSLTRVATDVDGYGTVRQGGHDPNSASKAADRIVPDAMRALAARAGSRPPALARLLARWLRPPRPPRGRPPAPADRQSPPPARLAAPMACCLADLEAWQRPPLGGDLEPGWAQGRDDRPNR